MLHWLNVLNAVGQEAAPAANPMGGCLNTMVFLAIIIVIFWLLVIRPQRKQQLEQTRFLDRLKEGDRIITSSGVFGRITKIESDVVTLDVGDRTRIRMLRSHVTRLQPDAVPATVPAASAELSEAAAQADGDGKKKK